MQGYHLGKRDDVRARIREIERNAATAQARAIEKVAYDRAVAMEETEVHRLAALEKGDVATAQKCSEFKAKLYGLLIDRQEIRTGALDNMPVDQQVRLLEAIKTMLETGQVIDVTPESVALTHQPEGETGDLVAEQDDGANTDDSGPVLDVDSLDTGDEDLSVADGPKS